MDLILNILGIVIIIVVGYYIYLEKGLVKSQEDYIKNLEESNKWYNDIYEDKNKTIDGLLKLLDETKESNESLIKLNDELIIELKKCVK